MNREINEPVNALMISRVTVANAVSIDLFSWLILFIQFIMIVYRRVGGWVCGCVGVCWCVCVCVCICM